MKIGNVDVKVSIVAVAVFVFFTIFLLYASLFSPEVRSQLYLDDSRPVHAACYSHGPQLHEPEPVQ